MTYSSAGSSFLLVAAFALALQVNAQVADAGPDTSLCVNFYTMQGSPLPLGATGVWTLVMGCGTITSPNAPASPITNLCIGSNVFVWTVDDNGTITSDVVEIIVFDAAMANANAGPDTITVVAPQNSAFLSGTPVPIFPANCWWSWVLGSGVIVDPSDPNTSVGGLTIGGNILLWTCDNGPCGTTSDTLVIQMMLSTGLADALGQGGPNVLFDPINHQLRVREAVVPDALDVIALDGRTILHSGRGQRAISTASLIDGVYLARAVVDGRPEVLRFVVSD